MKISIGTMAHAFDLSDEALRFYEKKGLVTPERNQQNGYRTFSRTDIQRIGNIKRYQNQGFSLEEISAIYGGIDEASLQALYQQKIDAARQAIRHQAHILARMQAATRAIAGAPELLYRPRRVRGEAAYVLEYESIEAMWLRLPEDPLLHRMFTSLPLTCFTTVIQQEGGHVGKGVLAFESDMDILGLDRSAFRRIDAADAVVCLFRLENGAFDIPNLVDAINRYLVENTLEAAGDLFTWQLASYVNEAHNAIHFAWMVAPVRSRA